MSLKFVRRKEVMATKIEWTDEVWNPVTGCSKISEGCQNCYAERMAKRFWGRPFSEIICQEHRLKKPYQWKKPRRIFVNSMGDLFHDDVPFGFIDKVFGKMAVCEHHLFMILTKRPKRMKEYIDKLLCNQILGAFPNVWLGVTAENQEHADKRIPILLETHAALRFVSCEPMLGQVDLNFDAINDLGRWDSVGRELPLRRIDWVICGAETGSRVREMSPEWARSLRDQCEEAEVPFFMKKMSYSQTVPDDLKIMEFPNIGNNCKVL